MQRHLEKNPFLAAGAFSIADIALYAYTHVAHEGGFDLEAYPAITASGLSESQLSLATSRSTRSAVGKSGWLPEV